MHSLTKNGRFARFHFRQPHRPPARLLCAVYLLSGFLLPSRPLCAQPLQLEVVFNFGLTNGAYPHAGLTLGADGQFYGTASYGGDGAVGTAFRFTTSGTLTTLGSFNGFNGESPYTPLTTGSDGHLYGTTWAGGVSNQGTAFRLTTNGTLTSLLSFVGTNGTLPDAALTLAGDGNLYGTTTGGGVSNYGTVFRLTTNGVLTTLVSFVFTNGANPSGALAIGNDSNLYGTASAGGPNNRGTVFKVTLNGVLTTVAAFDSTPPDPMFPYAGLRLSSDGAFYGTTYGGGNYSDYGTVFRVTTNGSVSTVALFQGGAGGWGPFAGLTLGRDGNYYGTTEYGGANNYGTVFKVSTNGALTTLFEFDGANGMTPYGDLALGPDGNLYGTAFQGGQNDYGVIYRLSLVPPTLSVRRSGPNVVLSWPTNAAGFVLIARSNLLATSPWTLVTNVPVIVGDQFVVTNATTSPSRYYGLVQSVGNPWLSSTRAGRNLIISWPTAAIGYTLQSTTNLSSASRWVPVTNVPFVTGSCYFVTNNMTGLNRFYRLVK
jgi:uncharacterized repeat protein (TIGR03803 family)